MKYDPANPTYDDLIWAVGNLTVWFNVLESYVLDETWDILSGGPEKGRLVTKHLTFARVVDLLIDAHLLDAKDRDHRDKLKRLRKDLKYAAEKRNEIVHGIWTPHGDPKRVLKGKSREDGSDIASVEDLAATIAEVHKAIQEIRILTCRVVDMNVMVPDPRDLKDPRLKRRPTT